MTGAAGVEPSLPGSPMQTHLLRFVSRSLGRSAVPSNSLHLYGAHGIQGYKRRSDLGARLLDIGHDEAVIPVDRR